MYIKHTPDLSIYIFISHSMSLKLLTPSSVSLLTNVTLVQFDTSNPNDIYIYIYVFPVRSRMTDIIIL